MNDIVNIILKTSVGIILLIICKVDMKERIIPDKLNGLIFVLGILVSTIDGIQGLEDHIVGILAVSIPMLVVNFFAKGAFGGGDIKLMASTGLFFGKEFIVDGAFIGIVLSGIAAVILLVSGEKKLNEHFPMGPFLVIGIFIKQIIIV